MTPAARDEIEAIRTALVARGGYWTAEFIESLHAAGLRAVAPQEKRYERRKVWGNATGGGCSVSMVADERKGERRKVDWTDGLIYRGRHYWAFREAEGWAKISRNHVPASDRRSLREPVPEGTSREGKWIGEERRHGEANRRVRPWEDSHRATGRGYWRRPNAGTSHLSRLALEWGGLAGRRSGDAYPVAPPAAHEADTEPFSERCKGTSFWPSGKEQQAFYNSLGDQGMKREMTGAQCVALRAAFALFGPRYLKARIDALRGQRHTADTLIVALGRAGQ
ncbi:MAG TPA: hypothetical protein VK681_39125 [Reyranella sp.]|nr:hypothetical protein [Reyranella sp.]